MRVSYQFCTSVLVVEGREARERPETACSVAAAHFVSAIHFTAAVQRSFSAVVLIKDDLILSCKGRELMLQRT